MSSRRPRADRPAFGLIVPAVWILIVPTARRLRPRPRVLKRAASPLAALHLRHGAREGCEASSPAGSRPQEQPEPGACAVVASRQAEGTRPRAPPEPERPSCRIMPLAEI